MLDDEVEIKDFTSEDPGDPNDAEFGEFGNLLEDSDSEVDASPDVADASLFYATRDEE